MIAATAAMPTRATRGRWVSSGSSRSSNKAWAIERGEAGAIGDEGEQIEEGVGGIDEECQPRQAQKPAQRADHLRAWVARIL